MQMIWTTPVSSNQNWTVWLAPPHTSPKYSISQRLQIMNCTYLCSKPSSSQNFQPVMCIQKQFNKLLLLNTTVRKQSKLHRFFWFMIINFFVFVLFPPPCFSSVTTCFVICHNFDRCKGSNYARLKIIHIYSPLFPY